MVNTKDTIDSSSLVSLLRTRADSLPNQPAFTFILKNGLESQHITYAELDMQARAIAAHLQYLGAMGERALLLYPPGLDFIAAFLGCLYAGVVAVPMYPPRRNRSNTRLKAIMKDARPYVILSDINYQFVRDSHDISECSQYHWLATNQVDMSLAVKYARPVILADSLAFLQYTSGSTAKPKGVMISHDNLLNNLTVIQQGFETTEEAKGLIWLPPYHDMGLISLLETLYCGGSALLLDPISILQKPARWLQTISRYQVTISGGPNFAYDLCVDHISDEQKKGLDLSSWAVAFNGSEKIQAETLSRFTNAFAGCGFRAEAFYPCYGLSETVLMASGGKRAEPPTIKHIKQKSLMNNQVVTSTPNGSTKAIVGCGYNQSGQEMYIVNPQTCTLCPPNQVGEIWLAGNSIAQGYWNQPQASNESFQAYLADSGDGPYLRTGDLGFVQDGELFVTGRIKELLIIRGRNHYPQDIEMTVTQSHFALKPNSGAAFAIEVAGEERLVVLQEIKRAFRKTIEADDVFKAIRQAVAEQYALNVHAILLLKPGSIPKTTSGKIQRQLCQKRFQEKDFQALFEDYANPPKTKVNGQHPTKPPQEAGVNAKNNGGTAKQPLNALVLTDTMPNQQLQPYTNDAHQHSTLSAQLLTIPAEQRQAHLLSALRSLVAEMFKLDVSHVADDDPLTSLGLSSIMAIRLIAEIEDRLGIDFPVAVLLEGATISQLTQLLNDQLASLAESSRATNGSHPKTLAKNVESPHDTIQNGSLPSETSETVIPPEVYKLEAFPELQAFQHLYDHSPIHNPYFRPHEQVNNNITQIKGKELINFSSYNYLSLSGDLRVSQASQAAIKQYGTSVSANRLVSGEIPLHCDLETELANLIGVEGCMVFVGGHATNVTTIGHLLRAGDLILHDELIHNSVLQGAALSGAEHLAFPHNDWTALDEILAEKRHHFQRVLIVIEGVYSMDGDIPDVPRFIEVKQRHKALLMIDEAHSMGTIGSRGRGISEYFSIDPNCVDIWMGTLSKTFASCGGYIAGSQALITYLKYTAPGFVYSVGISPPDTGAALAAIRLLKAEPQRATNLQAQAKLFLTLAKEKGLNTGLSQDSPIVPIIVGNSYFCSQLAKDLFERGISVSPIIFPAVAEETARLRFFINNMHTDAQIQFTVDTIADAFVRLS